MQVMLITAKVRYIVTSNPGDITAEGAVSPITVIGLTNGTAYTFKVKAVNAIEEGMESEVSNEITPQRASHGGGNDSVNNNPNGTLQNSSQSGIDILVNGNTETAATGTMTQNGDQTIMTVTVDGSKVEQRLEAEGNNAVVTIPVNNNSDVVVGQLNGQTFKNMETKEAVLEIRTNNVTYTLPASQINMYRLKFLLLTVNIMPK